jgi:SSS family solute:Na+ symporter
MAASGNLLTDILSKIFPVKENHKSQLRLSQILTLIIGVLALILALKMENVLELMLYSYAFMVSGLFIPLLGAFFGKRKNALAAIWSMMVGGTTTLILTEVNVELPLGLDPNIFGISASLVVFLLLTYLFPKYSTYTKL